MTSSPFFSILIPAYNAGKYIQSCIENVQKQSCQSWELLIVDDGSNDYTYKLCCDMAMDDERIHVFSQKNRGVSYSRNLLLSKAVGRYIIFLDADDYWNEVNMLDHIMQLCIRSDTDIVLWRAIKRDIQTGESSFCDNNSKISGEETGKEFLVRVLTKGDFSWWLWLYAIKKELWQDEKHRFNERRKICEDEEVLFKVIANAEKVCSMSNYYYVYNINNSSSAMGRINELWFKERLEVSKKNINYVKENVSDPRLRKLLVRNFASVYTKLAIKLNEDVFEDDTNLLGILKGYRWMLKESLGYWSLSFSIKTLILIIFGEKQGIEVIKLISTYKK